MLEIWKDVNEWEEFYEVSNFGRVRTKERLMMYDRNLGRGIEPKTVFQKIRKPKLNKHTGYLVIGMNGKGLSVNVTVHSMVTRAFIENYKHEGAGKGKCVNHKDGNKLNNNVENLEVITHKENIIHAFKNGLMPAHKVLFKGIEYYSKSEMRRQLNLSQKAQNKLLKGETPIKHTHKIKYCDIEYYSKAEMRRKLKISEKKQRKLIESGEIKLL